MEQGKIKSFTDLKVWQKGHQRIFKSQISNPNEISMTKFSNNKPYDLEERTAMLGEEVIDVLKRLPQNAINKRLIGQCTGAAGSLGANYCEANEAESKKDFQHKIGICKKETKEVKHWIRLLARANPKFKEEFRKLWQEAQELLLIFSKILRSSKVGKKKH